MATKGRTEPGVPMPADIHGVDRIAAVATGEGVSGPLTDGRRLLRRQR
jgi:hypothetical protein